MQDEYDVPSDGELRIEIKKTEEEIKKLEQNIKDLGRYLQLLKSMQQLNNEGRMEAMKILYELSHTKKYMKKYTPDGR